MGVSPVVVFHICAGIVGLLSGAAAMTFRKGSRQHVVAGNVFVVSMLSMAASGAYTGLIQHLALMPAQLMNVFNGVLTFYLVLTGWAAGRHKDGRAGMLDWAALVLILADGAGLVVNGLDAAHKKSGSIDGYPAGMYLFFGLVALLCAGGDVRMLVRGGLFGAHRIARHLWRMSFALLIAALSFFLGQQKVFPESVRGSMLFYVPPALVLFAMIFWLIRVRFTKAYKRTAALAGSIYRTDAVFSESARIWSKTR